MESRDTVPTPETLRVKILSESNARRQPLGQDIQGVMTVRRNSRKPAEELQKRGKKTLNQGAFKYKCFKCYKVGHKAIECRNSKSHPNTSANAEEEDVPAQSLVMYTGDDVKALHSVEKSGMYKTRWILDSGCTSHLCKDKERFEDLGRTSCDTLQMASDDNTKIAGKGVVSMTTLTKEGKRQVNFQNTLYVPDLRMNLVSVAKITERGFKINFDEKNQ